MKYRAVILSVSYIIIGNAVVSVYRSAAAASLP